MRTRELAKDKRSLLSALEGGYFPVSWFYVKGLLNNAWDFPSQPDGQEFAKWNLSLNLASDGSGLITRQGGKKSFNLSLGYGEIFKGRNVGAGSEWTTSVSMGFLNGPANGRSFPFDEFRDDGVRNGYWILTS
jgi:hypothetical protein